MNLSTIHVTKGCQLNNIVRCLTNLDLLEHLQPEQHIAAAWTPYNETVPHHIVMLQLKDIVSDSATNVTINAVLRSTTNESPFPFVFTVLNEITGIMYNNVMLRAMLLPALMLGG